MSMENKWSRFILHLLSPTVHDQCTPTCSPYSLKAFLSHSWTSIKSTLHIQSIHSAFWIRIVSIWWHKNICWIICLLEKSTRDGVTVCESNKIWHRPFYCRCPNPNIHTLLLVIVVNSFGHDCSLRRTLIAVLFTSLFYIMCIVDMAYWHTYGRDIKKLYDNVKIISELTGIFDINTYCTPSTEIIQ